MRRYLYPLLLIICITILLAMTLNLQRNLPGSLSENLALMPELSPPPGLYHKSITIRLKSSHPQGSIIFTTDGSKPSATSGTLYAQPLRLDGSHTGLTTIRAVEIVGENTSPIVTASYAVGFQKDIPLVVITGEPHALWEAEYGLLANPDRRGVDWEREVEFTLIRGENNDVSPQTAGLRIIGDPLLGDDKHSFRLYFRTEYNNPRLDFNPFRDDARQVSNIYKRLLLQAARDKHGVNYVTEQLSADILLGMGMPAAQGRIIHLIINGASWGLYRLTERVDNIFVEDNYNFVNADIVQEGNAREGTDDAWNLLLSLVNNPELDIEVIDSVIDTQNFIAMSCIQKYFQLPPDAFYAVHPQDGKWFWIYEGGGIKSIVNSDFNEIYSQLIKNVSFRMQYATRCGDILNSFLSSKAVFEKYTQYGKMLSSEFEFERIRWSNTPPWDIITKYQVDAITQSESRVRREIMKELHIPDIVNIKIQTEPVNNGTVYVNGTKILCADEIDNCQNVYFVDTELSFQPIPKQGYIFSQWDVVTGDGTSDTLSSNTFNLTPTTQYTITARFSPALTPGQEPSPGDIQINEYWIDDNGTRYSSVGYRAIAGDWIELLVDKPGRMDIRGWRITDNDTKNGSDEGSIILPEIEKLASLPKGTIILLITTKSPLNDENFPSDDLSVSDKQLIFYVGNGNLDVSTDPGFDINPANDNVVLLAPGLRNEFSDDNVIDFIAEGLAVTANSFGALKYGVAFDHGFSRLGIDDGALLTIRGSNDFSDDWIVDPDNCSSGDAICANARNIVTPGRINPGQSPLR